ncbi:MAG: NADH-quinone oxidoreductase subunit NuoE [Alphaproteobacteria bacterium]|jgi:NADH dehydrogenase (ubiquinone) flavoprotein 2|nr:NADH-quinone oxidoreductase subunit NuoE [Alphaproteobacteria bacterium]MCB1551528.1 NADH-quinone oxidoreductase subunit NuoE [Alphaproteobacteria bacterium]MCB9984898.1 NADH-quinone oxidoreductase subunit NuoE [Micavibrio sp.]HPQ51539.1 NADH-quinone oxidoreductase subunit NuoE [Alphaproteobacteria bacterium]
MKKPVDLSAAYQPKEFSFRDEAKVSEIISRYPAGKQRSAIMPLLDLAQRQVAEDGAVATPPYGGWIPLAAMDKIAAIVDVPPVKVYEVATFYSMYNLEPVGKYLVQMCTTTPCMLCGSGDVVKTCESQLGIHAGETTRDGMFTLMEVECLGACVNAPMVQINDDYYEDLTPESMKQILSDLQEGRDVLVGPQNGRNASMALSGTTTLVDQADKLGIKKAV